MRIAGITNLGFQTLQHSATPRFRGHWVNSVQPAPYPHEDTFISVNTYIADSDEPVDEIVRNYEEKAHNRDFLRPHTPYTLGENYFTDVSQNLEARKMQLTLSADRNTEEHRYLDAVKDKIKIARILAEQHYERDKFLTEEGIRQIYKLANKADRNDIYDAVWNYNPDMARGLNADLPSELDSDLY